VTMLFQQLVIQMTPRQICSKLLNKLWQCCSKNFSTRCLLNRLVASLLNIVVTMLFQQLVNKMSPQQACSKLVNKLCQWCSNNMSTRWLLDRFVASFLTSCDNAVPTICPIHFSQRVCSKLRNKL
jgi:hypothetical protein